MDSKNNVQSKINKVFSLMTKALKKIGYVELESVLKTLIVEEEFEEKKYDIIVNYILDCVVEEWKDHKIKKEDLFQYEKRGEVTVVRKMAVILIKENIDISDTKLSTYFGNRCRQVVYGIMTEYRKMDIGDRFDSKFLEKHNRIKEKIVLFLENLDGDSSQEKIKKEKPSSK
mgnify:CR=1 FL=1